MAKVPVFEPRYGGTYAYAAGTSAATVNVPANGRVQQVYAVSGSGGASTITIAGGDTITVPASTAFSTQITCDTDNQDVVFAGANLASYFVSWNIG